MSIFRKKYMFGLIALTITIMLGLGFTVNTVGKASAMNNAASTISFVPMTSGLSEPTAIASNESSNIYVTQRDGLIKIYNPQKGLLTTPWLDVSRLITTGGGEQGLLGLIFHPQFKTNGLAYITYTRPGRALVVAKVNTSKNWPTKVTPIIIIPHSGAQNHNGGSLAWHPHGELLVGTGDGGSGGDAFDNARWTNKPLGKILKVNVNSVKPTYTVWLSGLRNPWKMSVDTVTSQLWIADVGQDKYEEINRIPLNTVRADLGWPCREGFSSYDPGRCAGRTVMKPLTVFCHPDNVANCSATGHGAEAIIGGFVYRGASFAKKISGLYVAGDFVTGNFWTVSQTGSVQKVGALENLTSIGQTNTKEIVVTTYDGRLWKMKVN